MDMLNRKLRERERSYAPMPPDCIILRGLQRIMRHLLVADRVACAVLKDSRYDEVGHQECG